MDPVLQGVHLLVERVQAVERIECVDGKRVIAQLRIDVGGTVADVVFQRVELRSSMA